MLVYLFSTCWFDFSRKLYNILKLYETGQDESVGSIEASNNDSTSVSGQAVPRFCCDNVEKASNIKPKRLCGSSRLVHFIFIYCVCHYFNFDCAHVYVKM